MRRSLGGLKSEERRRQSPSASAATRSAEKRSVRMPDCSGLYTMTPVSCSAHQRISASAAWRRISENGGWSESTCRTASQRSSRSTSKLETPAARTFPSSTSRTISAQESSTAVPVSSGQWNW